jgi:hypothetical protein
VRQEGTAEELGGWGAWGQRGQGEKATRRWGDARTLQSTGAGEAQGVVEHRGNGEPEKRGPGDEANAEHPEGTRMRNAE